MNYFWGILWDTSDDAKTLFTTVKDALLRFNFYISYCRGQCYDGAADVSGVLSELQARVQLEKPRAVYVHCIAHCLNLVMQDVMQHIQSVRNFITLMWKLIGCIRNSPKRLACFETLQEIEAPARRLRSFCPTRWCLRATSLRSVASNYATFLMFLDKINNTDVSDTGAKAHGFLTHLKRFYTFFILQPLFLIFVEIVE